MGKPKFDHDVKTTSPPRLPATIACVWTEGSGPASNAIPEWA
jgi:hypothetical protein